MFPPLPVHDLTETRTGHPCTTPSLSGNQRPRAPTLLQTVHGTLSLGIHATRHVTASIGKRRVHFYLQLGTDVSLFSTAGLPAGLTDRLQESMSAWSPSAVACCRRTCHPIPTPPLFHPRHASNLMSSFEAPYMPVFTPDIFHLFLPLHLCV